MIKLNLGAGNKILEGYVNHDLKKHRKEIDVFFDLNLPDWPLQNDGFDRIFAFDVIEHVKDPVNFMDNCWKLLQYNGILYVKACGWQNPNFWVDITHHRAFDIKSFDYFVPTTEAGRVYNYYTDKKWTYREGYPMYDKNKNIMVKMVPIKS